MFLSQRSLLRNESIETKRHTQNGETNERFQLNIHYTTKMYLCVCIKSMCMFPCSTAYNKIQNKNIVHLTIFIYINN